MPTFMQSQIIGRVNFPCHCCVLFSRSGLAKTMRRKPMLLKSGNMDYPSLRAMTGRYPMHLNSSFNRIILKMTKQYEKLLSVLSAPEPPAGLAQKIISRIERRERRFFFARMAGFGACLIGSLSLAGFGFINAVTELSHSGFFSFASLVFSDFSSAIANFPDFILSITESLPVIPIALLFGGIVFFLWSMAYFAKGFSIRSRAHQFSVSK